MAPPLANDSLEPNWNSPDFLQNHLLCLHILSGRKMVSDALFAVWRINTAGKAIVALAKQAGPIKAGPMLRWFEKAGLNKAGWWPWS